MDQATRQNVNQNAATALDRILQTESEALARIAQAKERTRHFVVEAQESVAGIAKDGERSARTLAAEGSKTIKTATREQIAQIDRDRHVLCEKLKIELQGRYEGALAFIVSLVTEPIEDSADGSGIPSAVVVSGGISGCTEEGQPC